jgi:hypothetical protein
VPRNRPVVPPRWTPCSSSVPAPWTVLGPFTADLPAGNRPIRSLLRNSAIPRNNITFVLVSESL